MKKNKSLYFLTPLLILMGLNACYKDKSTFGDKTVSTITIGVQKEQLNVNSGFELVFDPQVTQTIEGGELQYDWGLCDYDENAPSKLVGESVTISNEPILRHVFNKLGIYVIQLKVTNEFGGKVRNFILNVNTEFEEGLIVLSVKDSGVSNISFLKTLTPEDIEAGKVPAFISDVYSIVNPDYPISEATDIDKIMDNVIITTESGFYYLDDKTFDLLNIFNPGENNPLLIPQELTSIDYKDWDLDYNYILTKDGKVYQFNPELEWIMERGDDAKGGWDKSFQYMDYMIWSTIYKSAYNYYIDFDESAVGYKDNMFNYIRRFPDYEIVNMIHTKYAYKQQYYIITAEKSNPDLVTIHNGAYHIGSVENTYTYEEPNLTLNKEAIMVVNKNDNCAYYNAGNKLYKWQYGVSASNHLPAEPAITLEDGKEITCMVNHMDDSKLYVGVYDPSATGKKGSVHVYQLPSLELEAKYEGVADKPVKIIYKYK